MGDDEVEIVVGREGEREEGWGGVSERGEVREVQGVLGVCRREGKGGRRGYQDVFSIPEARNFPREEVRSSQREWNGVRAWEPRVPHAAARVTPVTG
ncbi:hypothetical protein E2C01_057487 [Portunus trituberculatus]|uniref:Uncharacterized protein n=1 Tax=Portunus trituberculatus TaxID=210409 RepID=A0A5B7H0G6_PORTR|nr:hypothetical protein [Portunus trituberculatus]